MKSGIITPFIDNNNVTNRLLMSVLGVHVYYITPGREDSHISLLTGCLLCLLVTLK